MGSNQPIVVFDTAIGRVLQRYVPSQIKGSTFAADRTGSFSGVAYAPDGRRLIFSQDDNHLVIARVDPVTGLLSAAQSLDLPPPPADGRPYHNPRAINPGGIAISEDGKHAYVALNAANTLGVVDLTSTPPRLTGQIPVGNAPNSVVLHGGFAYVSNEGGRPAVQGDYTNESDGTPIVADRTSAFSTTGTVSVVDLAAGRQVGAVSVGLHPAGMTIAAGHLYVANAYSDSLSIVSLETRTVERTIDLSVPIAGGVFGAGPDGVAVTQDAEAYVTLGQANAVAVVDLKDSARPRVRYVPTAYFPTSIVYDAGQKQIIVADDKGLGSQGGVGTAQGVSGFSTYNETGAVNLIPLPGPEALWRYTAQVFSNNHWDDTETISVGPKHADPHAKPVAVPRHIGEPSLIKHVFLIIKENRTYDQMLGDVAWGNGDPSLAVFASALPNQHALVRRFPLLDNVYAPSRQSADGHPWIGMSGSFYSNDILSPDWIRSYPGGDADDALAYTPRGFLFTAAEAKGLSVKMYGEWGSESKVSKKPDGSSYHWTDFYQTALCKEGKAPVSNCVVPDGAIRVSSNIPAADRILDRGYPMFDLDIPDQYRADYWISAFKALDGAGKVPNLSIIWLPNDHTAGTSKGKPYPINYEADNDLALGRMVEAISHSKVWAQTAIFIEEDDAQNGVDHIDGHRQPVYVVSPYAVAPQAPGQGKAIHTLYTAENINRTIENILGTPPLTQFDLVASPMFDAFQDTANLAPFDHEAAVIPLDQGPGLGGAPTAAVSPMEKSWLKASAEVMKGKYDKADAIDPNFLNHASWYATTGWKRPYPGETKVLRPWSLVKAAEHYDGDGDGDGDD